MGKHQLSLKEDNYKSILTCYFCIHSKVIKIRTDFFFLKVIAQKVLRCFSNPCLKLHSLHGEIDNHCNTTILLYTPRPPIEQLLDNNGLNTFQKPRESTLVFYREFRTVFTVKRGSFFACNLLNDSLH